MFRIHFPSILKFENFATRKFSNGVLFFSAVSKCYEFSLFMNSLILCLFICLFIIYSTALPLSHRIYYIHRKLTLSMNLLLIFFYICRYYSVSINIGKGTEAFEFDIDSGSDLTWVQCDAPCTGCTKVSGSDYNNSQLDVYSLISTVLINFTCICSLGSSYINPTIML